MERKEIKKEFLKNISEKDIEKVISNVANKTSHKEEILWAAKDIAKEEPRFALKVAQYFENSKDPDEKHPLNVDLKKGEETRNITSIRATLPYLLQGIAASLQTELFPEIIRITEKLSTDPVAYVRQQSCVALDILAANRYAKKRLDETPFPLSEESRQRIEGIVLNMLRDKENQKYDTVMEYIAMPIGRLRGLDQNTTAETIETILYNQKGEFRAYETCKNIFPVLIYYAEFRKDFANKYFQDYLKKAIKESPPELRSTIIWYLWKVIKEDLKNLEKIKKYFDTILETPFDEDVLGQVDFLIENTTEANPQKGADLFLKVLDWVEIPKEHIMGRDIFFHQAEKHLENLLKIYPEHVQKSSGKLLAIDQMGGYVGSPKIIQTISDENDKRT